MKFKLIACKSMSRELSYLTSLSPNIFDITWIRQGFHDTPDILRKTLQNEVDMVESGKDPHTNALMGCEVNPRTGTMEGFDAILIGYCLCSNGIVGLHSKSHTLVIPRGHDCITMFLGSKERYADCFKNMPGCFWYTASWIENCTMPCEEANRRELDIYREQGFDEDEIEYFKDMLQGWTKNYHYAAYVKMPFYDNPEQQKFTREAADYFGWEYAPVEGNMCLMEKFVAGDWDPRDFLIVPPGYRVYATNDERIIDCEKIPE